MADLPPPPRGPDAVTHLLPAGELPPGWKLLEGQYEITRLIASGGFGITYLARDTLGRDVAVKECFPLGLAQRATMTHTVSATSAGTSEHFETARAQFLREARMLAALSHPNVVHVQSLFEENGTAYMAMDFIHGQDLHEVIAQETLSPARVLDLSRNLLRALDYVHAQGVLHRDIKPQNIRIDRFEMPMLIDFGAARAETQARSRMAGTFRVVTDGYSPHEFYVTGAPQGPHSDLYALAATLYHVITGAAPVAADERASAMATGQSDPFVPISGQDRDQIARHDARLLALIDRALAMVPGDRPSDAAEWLTALTDARTTLIAPHPAPPSARAGRLWLGLALGAGVTGAVAAGIWMQQPAWLSPGMDEMQAELGSVQAQLVTAEQERRAVEATLDEVRTTLSTAEAEVQRLETAGGSMAETLAELDAARAARDTAAQQITALQAELDALGEQARAADEARRLLEAETTRAADAAAAQQTAEQAARALAQQIAELEADGLAASARITTLEASLADATSRLVEARTNAALLTRTEQALEVAMDQVAALEAQAQTADARSAELDAAQAEITALQQDLAAATAARAALDTELAALEQSRADLADQVAALNAAPQPDPEEVARLQEQVTALTGENGELRNEIRTLASEATALRATLAETEAALQAALAARPEWMPHATLPAPNGTFTLLPRFSWDNRRIAAVDSAGGIALFDRASGRYEAHLARGIPDRVLRLGFSAGGSYLIATTPDGSPNRLYDVRARREILRFEPATVTTAIRAISRDEQYFVFTRADGSGQVDIVITPLDTLRDPATPATEQVLSSVPENTPVRIAFSETDNYINVLTPTSARVYGPDGRLLRTGPNRIGRVAALSPVGQDQGFLVLRSNGAVQVYNDLIDQEEIASVAARADYTLYRLSGDRQSFLRAHDEAWEVLDLLSGEVRGAGPIEADPHRASISISADGETIFIGATDTRPARLLDVATGLELQSFGTATQGYFSFDNTFLATGRADGGEAQIWRLEGTMPGPDLSDCAVLDRAMDGIPMLPNALESRAFSVVAGGEVALSFCAEAQEAGLTAALSRARVDLSTSAAPDVAINILGTARTYSVTVAAEGLCEPMILARFAEEWSLGQQVTFTDTGDATRPLDIWLATPEGVSCDARIVLSGGEN